MTYPYDNKSRDRLEVSPEMVDAGLEIFLTSYPESGTGDWQDRQMVQRIYEAMASLKLARTGTATGQQGSESAPELPGCDLAHHEPLPEASGRRVPRQL